MKLSKKDILALGLMHFALFVGAGNIIFPPLIGYSYSNSIILSSIGFILTGVGLPILGTIAICKFNGSIDLLSRSAGKILSTLIIVTTYLCIGPLFATPRTATVSFEIGIYPFIHDENSLIYFSFIYFSLVGYLSLHPSTLLDMVGKFLTPIKITALAILILGAFYLVPKSSELEPVTHTQSPFLFGLTNGYLTMDTLAAFAFSFVIINVIKYKGVSNNKDLMKYTSISGLIAGLLMCLLYIGLIYVGSVSSVAVESANNGADILVSIVNYCFGLTGNVLLAIVITLACFITSVGLVCSSGSYFSELLGIKYKTSVIAVTLISMFISNVGLSNLISISVPALKTIYPSFIILVFNAFIPKWTRPFIKNILLLSLTFGFIDAFISPVFISSYFPLYTNFPFYDEGLVWVIPCLVYFITLMLIHKVPELYVFSKKKG